MQEKKLKMKNKLQFYVNKHIGHNEPSGLYHALQLAGEETKNNQNGFIFYVPAWNTSKIDPITGFVNMFTLKYTNIKDAKKFFNTFDIIKKNNDTEHYEFTFKYSRMSKIKAAKYINGTKDDWTISTHGCRIVKEQNDNHWKYRDIDSLTSEFDRLFAEYGIEINGNIQQNIMKCNNATFYKKLIILLKWTLQLRNYDDKGNDYIISPILYDNQNYYNSTDYKDSICSQRFSKQMPQDADANGAYNIARKGWLLYNKIREGQTQLTVTQAEWLQYAPK